MTRPSVKQTSISDLISISIPEDRMRSILVDIARHIANSDTAIQHAVKIAQELDQGGVTDSTYESFRRSLGIYGATTFTLWRKEALAFADDLCDLLHGGDTIEITPKGATLNVAMTDQGLKVTTGGTTR